MIAEDYISEMLDFNIFKVTAFTMMLSEFYLK